jgi:twitching motility protein PilJ
MMTAHYQAALHSYAEGRYEDAMQQFSELLHEDPRNPKLHIWLGATFRKAGKIEYAKVQYQQVLSLTNDPDLLDLASTSLAQIQSKLANASRRTVSQKNSPETFDHHQNRHQESSLQEVSHQDVVKNANTNGLSANGHTANNFFISDQDVATEDFTLLAPPSASVKAASKPQVPTSKIPINVQSNGNSAVPPPPAIAALLKNQPTSQSPQLQSEQMVVFDETSEEISDDVVSLTLIDTIASIQETNPKNKRDKKNKAKAEPAAFKTESNKNKLSQSNSKPIALEDMFRLSTVAQKITLWGALVATIPAIALGVSAYQVGNSLLLSKINQAQQSEAIALAKQTGSFLQQQTAEVKVLKTLLISSEVGQNTLQNSVQNPTQSPAQNPSDNNKAVKPIPSISSLPIAQQRLYKQQLTNRLNLYSQAYPQYTSIAIFSTSGELLAQSANSKDLQTLNPEVLNKSTSTDNVLIGNPVISKDGAYFYAVTLVKSPSSQKASMVLQVEIPVKTLVSELTNTEGSNFYIIDSSNKYVASSQSVSIGEDASSDFAMLTDLRSTQSPNLREVARDDRSNVQILAYADIPNMPSYGILDWDMLTTIDKARAISGNQNLLLVISFSVAATPLLVAAIAYALSRRLSSRLKDIRSALQDLRRGDSNTSLGKISEPLRVKGNDELSDISVSINIMSEQFQTMMQKQEQEKQHLQMQVVKLFQVLSKLAREEKSEVQDADLSDASILRLGRKVRAEMVQRNAEAENYSHQKEDMQRQLIQMLRDMQTLANGDLTVSTQSVNGDLANVSTFFDEVMRGLQNIIGQVKSSANQVNFSLGQNEQAIANLSSISQRQVDTVTRSLNTAQMFQLSATTIVNKSQQAIQSSRSVSEKISDSDRSIDVVMEKIEELQNTVLNTAKRVKHLGEVSQKVSLAISSINEIAVKTNFLSINASLEASRTGDMGGGFIIVAEEVGELASRSVAATKEVESLLGIIQRETNEVMNSIESGSNQVAESNTLAIAAKDSLQQIAQISQQIDGLMSTIAEATVSQVQTSEGVANLMKDISHIANRTLTSSSEASKFIKSTRRHSGDLQQSLASLKTR